jgi:hypothetical protein
VARVVTDGHQEEAHLLLPCQRSSYFLDGLDPISTIDFVDDIGFSVQTKGDDVFACPCRRAAGVLDEAIAIHPPALRRQPALRASGQRENQKHHRTQRNSRPQFHAFPPSPIMPIGERRWSRYSRENQEASRAARERRWTFAPHWRER